MCVKNQLKSISMSHNKQSAPLHTTLKHLGACNFVVGGVGNPMAHNFFYGAKSLEKYVSKGKYYMMGNLYDFR